MKIMILTQSILLRMCFGFWEVLIKFVAQRQFFFGIIFFFFIVDLCSIDSQPSPASVLNRTISYFIVLLSANYVLSLGCFIISEQSEFWDRWPPISFLLDAYLINLYKCSLYFPFYFDGLTMLSCSVDRFIFN